MIVQQLEKQRPFTTKDGSTIRSILNRENAPVEKHSMAEASLPPGMPTQLHHHKRSEEFYFMLEGRATMEIEGEIREVGPGDAILIPAGSWHQITAHTPARFLCSCAPPYDHADTYFE